MINVKERNNEMLDLPTRTVRSGNRTADRRAEEAREIEGFGGYGESY